MERFIVIVGKTILSTLDDRILFTRKDDSCSIEEWLSNTFQARLLRQEAHHQLNISFLYTSDIRYRPLGCPLLFYYRLFYMYQNGIFIVSYC
jgi:hypothetical protein